MHVLFILGICVNEYRML